MPHPDFFIMPKDATLNPDVLIDCLVEDIDCIRKEIHGCVGTRAFNVCVITRTWSGTAIGDGTYTDTELVLDPPPLVKSWVSGRSYEYGLTPAGLGSEGNVLIQEISLGYTYECLAGEDTNGDPCIPATAEFFYKIEGAHGQQFPVKYFSVARPPYPDRIKNMGWEVLLTAEDR